MEFPRKSPVSGAAKVNKCSFTAGNSSLGGKLWVQVEIREAQSIIRMFWSFQHRFVGWFLLFSSLVFWALIPCANRAFSDEEILKNQIIFIPATASFLYFLQFFLKSQNLGGATPTTRFFSWLNPSLKALEDVEYWWLFSVPFCLPSGLNCREIQPVAVRQMQEVPGSHQDSRDLFHSLLQIFIFLRKISSGFMV